LNTFGIFSTFVQHIMLKLPFFGTIKLNTFGIFATFVQFVS